MARRSPEAPRRRGREIPGSSRRTWEPRARAMAAESDASFEWPLGDAPESPERGVVPARTVLDIRDLRAGYQDISVLRGVTLSVAPAEVVALVGANGAGKTTMLRAIAGLLTPEG